MARCQVCGNDYDKAMTITLAGETHSFDCFECAIQALAPTCARCGVRILGHGAEADGSYYCGASCAHEAGVAGVEDRV